MEVISVYGIHPFTPKEIEENEIRLFTYLKALIQAELINPEDDYDGDREMALLKKVAISSLSASRRTELVTLLIKDENTEDAN